jgi:ubiquinone/menaquinone biosynthesis C-methylase UbiE
LETGCGAGLLTVALAQRGFVVDALDPVPTMLDLTRAAASDLGVESRVRAVAGDVHHLQYPDDSFHAVLGLGVLPWLHSPQLALTEMARVLKPGGYLLVTVDNLWRLNDVLDPRRTPVFGFFRRIFSLGRHHWRAFRNHRLVPTLARLDSTHDLDSGINAAGLTRIKSVTLGFGPFSIWDKPMFNEATGIALHRKLQSLADRNFPILRSTGAHYVVLARKWTA